MTRLPMDDRDVAVDEPPGTLATRRERASAPCCTGQTVRRNPAGPSQTRYGGVYRDDANTGHLGEPQTPTGLRTSIPGRRKSSGLVIPCHIRRVPSVTTTMTPRDEGM
jgi:hypothetical protein